MAGKQRAEQLAELCRQREEEDRQQRVMIITEFAAGDRDATMHAMADEILKYRQALRWLAAAIGWAEAGAPFGLVAPALSGVRGGPARVTSCRGSNEVELSNRKTRP